MPSKSPLCKTAAKPSSNVQARLMCDVKEKPVTWLMPGWIPRGKTTVVDGDPDLGKSTVLLDLAATVSKGGVMPNGHQVEADNVILMSAEDDAEDTIRPRLRAAGANLELIGILDQIEERPIVLPWDVPTIKACVMERQAVLLIIDPLMAFLDADARSDQEVRRALYPLKQMAEQTGCAVVMQRHLNKGGGSKAVYRGGGSIGIIAAARSGILIAQDPDSPEHRIMAQTKRNLAAAQQSLRYHLEYGEEFGACRVVWDGVSQYQADDLLAPPAGEAKSLKEEAAALLQELLAKGAMPSADCYKAGAAAGFSKKVLWKAKEHLGVKACPNKDQDGKVQSWDWKL
jgi:hypothetical protein